MMLIQKIERALVLAKDLGLSDEKTKEFMAVILDLPYLKLNLNPPFVPIVPCSTTTAPNWPGIGSPLYPGDTICNQPTITFGMDPMPSGVTGL